MIPRKLRTPVSLVLRERPLTVFTSPDLIIKAKRTVLGYNRFAVVIRIAVEPRSVRRHALKRAILGRVKDWPSPLSCDFVFFPARPAASLSRRTLSDELSIALRQINSRFSSDH